MWKKKTRSYEIWDHTYNVKLFALDSNSLNYISLTKTVHILFTSSEHRGCPVQGYTCTSSPSQLKKPKFLQSLIPLFLTRNSPHSTVSGSTWSGIHSAVDQVLMLSEWHMSLLSWWVLTDVLTSHKHDPGTIPIKPIDMSLSSEGTLSKPYLNHF